MCHHVSAPPEIGVIFIFVELIAKAKTKWTLQLWPTPLNNSRQVGQVAALSNEAEPRSTWKDNHDR